VQTVYAATRKEPLLHVSHATTSALNPIRMSSFFEYTKWYDTYYPFYRKPHNQKVFAMAIPND